MESILKRLSEKIAELGSQKVLLLDQVNKLRLENEELSKKLKELKLSQQSKQGTNDDRNRQMENKIDSMVKEIDKCIEILNNN